MPTAVSAEFLERSLTNDVTITSVVTHVLRGMGKVVTDHVEELENKVTSLAKAATTMVPSNLQNMATDVQNVVSNGQSVAASMTQAAGQAFNSAKEDGKSKLAKAAWDAIWHTSAFKGVFLFFTVGVPLILLALMLMIIWVYYRKMLFTFLKCCSCCNSCNDLDEGW
ncbi:hypothetical protein P154DRAFT_581531 [Amniculicola lignicola CBS 123094]|uniref:Uncharacterized protein n=1 Tax=Amniculicola lignicola CBS 123094 TaxID=1392246 RepID=A0A6A5W6B4_9PLEO|nr:hypothetical protein P154DRAFT_581531 [Amniculicola lignicola CBS 123094]